MSNLKDVLKREIRKQLLGQQTNTSKYRLGVASSLNADGTCNVVLDGKQVIATPLYPTVAGQEVAVVFDASGRASAVPTRPNTAPAENIVPPFFSGGGALFRFATMMVPDSGIPTGVNFGDLAVQESGNSKIYVVPATTPLDPSGPIDFGRWAFSPNGQYIAYLFENIDGSTNTGQVALYKLGATPLSSSVVLDPTFNLYKFADSPVALISFSLAANEVSSAYTAGIFALLNLAVDDSGTIYYGLTTRSSSNPNNYQYGANIYSAAKGASSATLLVSVNLGSVSSGLLVDDSLLLVHFWHNNSGIRLLLEKAHVGPGTFSLSTLITDLSTSIVYYDSGSQAAGAFAVASKGREVVPLSDLQISPTNFLVSEPLDSGTIEITALSGFNQWVSTAPYTLDGSFGLGAFSTGIVILVTKGLGSYVVDDVQGGDSRTRFYKIVGNIGSTFSPGSTPEKNISPGISDSTVIRIWDLTDPLWIYTNYNGIAAVEGTPV